jgi:hypothetical protein
MRCKLEILTTLLLTHKTYIPKNIDVVYYDIKKFIVNMSWPLEVVLQHKETKFLV